MTTGFHPLTLSDTRSGPDRRLRRMVWLIPLHGVLLTWTTWQQQPSPRTELADWSAFVTTDHFLVSHVLGSIGGQLAAVLGVVALTVLVLARTSRPGVLLTGSVLHVVGSGLMIAGFGVAAFAQPAVGELHADSPALAEAAYRDVYGPVTTVVLLLGLASYSLSYSWLGRALTGTAGLSTWVGRLTAVAGPVFGIAGFFVGGLQTLGALLLVVSGVGLATALREVPDARSEAVIGEGPRGKR